MKNFLINNICKIQIHQHRQASRKKVNLFVNFIIRNLQWDIQKYC